MRNSIALIALTILLAAASVRAQSTTTSAAADTAPRAALASVAPAAVAYPGIAETVHQSVLTLRRARMLALIDPSLRMLNDPALALRKATTQASASVSRTSSAPASQPAVAIAAVAPAAAPAVVPAAASAPAAIDPMHLPPDVVEKLRTAAAHEPLELADRLFEAQKLHAAEIFYEKARPLDRYKGDADWILFQIANCRSIREPASAVELYQKLLRDYPKSTWCPVAASRMQLLAWRENLAQQQAQRPPLKKAGR